MSTELKENSSLPNASSRNNLGPEVYSQSDGTGVWVAEPGSVMVFGNEGKLCECDKAYDKRIAGVISGWGLDKQHGDKRKKRIALLGKVYCKVDAGYAAIEVGDLLTTSPSAGHAMKATDQSKIIGSVIGKALKPIKQGKGLIPILVSLQ